MPDACNMLKLKGLNFWRISQVTIKIDLFAIALNLVESKDYRGTEADTILWGETKYNARRYNRIYNSITNWIAELGWVEKMWL